MFRITKAFENDLTQIIRVEGKIVEENLEEWEHEMKQLKLNNGKQVILDLAQLWFITGPAVEVLIRLMSDHLYIMNCGMEVRNVLHASGYSQRMLE